MKLPFEKETKKIIIKEKSKASWGVKSEDRPISKLLQYGIINIDKPAGPTSHNVAAFVQKILKCKKAGHSGTLDPNVTGCLPVALGDATKVCEALLTAGKEYVCVMQLHEDIDEEEIIEALDASVGKIEQLPPVKSAVKRQIRTREIYYIKFLEKKGRNVLFIVGCEAGTYIRRLCEDVGKLLGVKAHMLELRRTKAGPFDESSLVTLNDLRDAFEGYKEASEHYEKQLKTLIQPVENAVLHMKKLWVKDDFIPKLKNGQNLMGYGISKLHDNISKNDPVAVMSLKGELLCLGSAFKSSKEMLKTKAPCVKIHKVLIGKL